MRIRSFYIAKYNGFYKYFSQTTQTALIMISSKSLANLNMNGIFQSTTILLFRFSLEKEVSFSCSYIFVDTDNNRSFPSLLVIKKIPSIQFPVQIKKFESWKSIFFIFTVCRHLKLSYQIFSDEILKTNLRSLKFPYRW